MLAIKLWWTRSRRAAIGLLIAGGANLNKRPYLIIGWILAILSVIAVIAVPLLPERHWNFMAQTRFNVFLVTDQNKGGDTA